MAEKKMNALYYSKVTYGFLYLFYIYTLELENPYSTLYWNKLVANNFPFKKVKYELQSVI